MRRGRAEWSGSANGAGGVERQCGRGGARVTAEREGWTERRACLHASCAGAGFGTTDLTTLTTLTTLTVRRANSDPTDWRLSCDGDLSMALDSLRAQSSGRLYGRKPAGLLTDWRLPCD